MGIVSSEPRSKYAAQRRRGGAAHAIILSPSLRLTRTLSRPFSPEPEPDPHQVAPTYCDAGVTADAVRNVPWHSKYRHGRCSY